MKSLIWILPIALAAVLTAEGADLIPPAEHRRLDLAVADYFAGKMQPALGFFSALASNASDAKVAAVDRSLAEKKLPPLAELLAQARLTAIHGGTLVQLGRPRPREVLIELPALVGHLGAELGFVRNHRLLKQPLPAGATLVEYERLLDAAQGLTNTLTGAKQVAEYLEGFVKLVPSAERARLAPPLAEIVRRDYRAEAAGIQELVGRLAAVDAVLRVRRLKRARDALNGNAPRSERLLAAHTCQEDAARLATFFRGFKGGLKVLEPYDLSELNDPGLAGRVRGDADECRRLAGPLTAKANELYAALHWWKRGRYGEGPELFGLAKPENASVSQEAARDLYMPDEPPHPTAPSGLVANVAGQPARPDVPRYPMRHLYWWAWENQQLAAGHIYGLSDLADQNMRLVMLQGETVVFWPHYSH